MTNPGVFLAGSAVFFVFLAILKERPRRGLILLKTLAKGPGPRIVQGRRSGHTGGLWRTLVSPKIIRNRLSEVPADYWLQADRRCVEPVRRVPATCVDNPALRDRRALHGRVCELQ